MTLHPYKRIMIMLTEASEDMPNYEFYNLLQELSQSTILSLVDRFNRVDSSLQKELKAVIIRKVALMRKYSITGEATTVQYIISDALNGVIIDPDDDKQEMKWKNLSFES